MSTRCLRLACNPGTSVFLASIAGSSQHWRSAVLERFALMFCDPPADSEAAGHGVDVGSGWSSGGERQVRHTFPLQEAVQTLPEYAPECVSCRGSQAHALLLLGHSLYVIWKVCQYCLRLHSRAMLPAIAVTHLGWTSVCSCKRLFTLAYGLLRLAQS